MKQALEALLTALRAGEDAVLCTILEASGSTPRGAGAKMAVFSGGGMAGTVGGGPVEHRCRQTALRALAAGRSQVERFQLRQGNDLGMICGGDVTVFFQMFRAAVPEHLALLEGALALLAAHKDSWMVTSIGTAGEWSAELAAQPDAALERRPVLTGAGPWRYAEPLGRAGRIFLFGGGHVSQALTPVLAQVDFPVVICEDRTEFADPARFPAAQEVVMLDFARALARFPVGEADGIVIMTRGHQNDYQVLRQALETGAGYLGVIGSRAKAAATFERLRAGGFTQADLDRVHTPIGLPIGAETPQEIAVSVAAELIRWRAIRTGGKGKL
ncbi:MAG: XdhC family protein [Oscillospiraceae bacterium]|nr:XdhC family protein [Oscillospiraceae bacterium]